MSWSDSSGCLMAFSAEKTDDVTPSGFDVK